MKLYEFTFNDNTNLTESAVLASATDALKEEARLQRWAPGYVLRQRHKSKQMSDGTIEYYFEVAGEYIVEGQSGDEQESSPSSQPRSGVAASP